MSVDVKSDKQVQAKPEMVTLTIDGTEVSVPKGTLIIRAAEMIGTAIPRFCDHPLLDPVGACRQCMVEIPDAGNGRGFPKPQASCTMPVAEGMVVNTQVTSAVAEKAQRGMLELLLINHPLDCPICDKGGECPLQNQALSNGPGESRYQGVKRTYPKPVSISANILLDRERCVLCARCTRFSEQISGDPFIALVERGALQQVGFYEDHPYDSYFSGNVVQICPVGALTSADYRFQARPFDLVSTDTSCEHCAGGCSLRVDHRHFQVKRRLAGLNDQVNEEWNCDRGRFAFKYGRLADRLTRPLVRRDGVLEPASWPEAIDVAVAGLKKAGSSVGLLTGGRLLQEAAYGYAKFARAVLGTNSIDHRARALSAEETNFLASYIAPRRFGDTVTFTDLENASKVVLVCFEPEDESPSTFLRLRKAWRKKGLKVVTLAPFASRGSLKMGAEVIGTVPGREAEAVAGLEDIDAGTIILVGERAATSPGTLSAVVKLAESTGARFTWIPRRAGEVGSIQAGCLPNCLPGGRPLSDAAARVDVATHWGVETLPSEPGLDAEQMIVALAEGRLKAAIVAGVQPKDFADPHQVRTGLEEAEFVISIEQRMSEVSERADVVFPVALIEEQSGTFINWESRQRPVQRVNEKNKNPMTDLRVLAALADALGHDLGFRTPAAARADLAELGLWPEPVTFTASNGAMAAPTGVTLASWRLLLDDSAALDGAVHLAQTAPKATAKLSAALAESLGNPETVTVSGPNGSLTLPSVVAENMVDSVVWLPANTDAVLFEALGARAGDEVQIVGGAK